LKTHVVCYQSQFSLFLFFTSQW